MRFLTLILTFLTILPSSLNAQTSTLGRHELIWPDLGYPGGAPQVALIHAAVEKLSDSTVGRFFEATIADTATSTFTHNLETDFDNIKVLLFDGQGTSKTLITTTSTPALSDFTVVANGGNPRTQIDVTNNSGGNEDLTILFVDGGETFDTPQVLQNLTVFDRGELRLNEDATNGTEYAGFKAPVSLAGNLIWSLPSTDGSSGQVLKTDGTLGLGWASALTNPMTTTGDIIYSSDGLGTPARLAFSGPNTVLKTAGGSVPSWGAIVNADVDASAAIAVSKLAALTASRVALTDGSGFLTPSTLTSANLENVNYSDAAYGTDNRLLRSDSTGRKTQASAISVDDSGNMTGVGTLGAGAATLTSVNFGGSTLSTYSESVTTSAWSAHTGSAITFTSGTVRCTKVGRLVTCTLEDISFTSGASTGGINSGAVIPAAMRPVSSMTNIVDMVVDADKLAAAGTATSLWMYVDSTGVFILRHKTNSDGLATSFKATTAYVLRGSLSWTTSS